MCVVPYAMKKRNLQTICSFIVGGCGTYGGLVWDGGTFLVVLLSQLRIGRSVGCFFSPSHPSNRACITLFFATVWTIWEFRNHKVFNDVDASSSIAVDTIQFCVAWWFKDHGCGSMDPITSLLQCVSEHCKDPSKPKAMFGRREGEYDGWMDG